jgi:polar amino acid transport system substrate-binding protein
VTHFFQKILGLLSVVFVYISPTLSYAECSRPLRYALSDWKPYAFKDAIAEGHGIDADILQAVAKQAGCRIEILSDVPGARSHLMFKQGLIDVFTGYSYTDERTEFARYTHSYRDEVVGVYSLNPKIKSEEIKNFDDVLNKKYFLVAPASGFYGSSYAAAEPVLLERKQLSKVDGAERALKMLMKNRGDLVFNDSYVLQYTALTMRIGALKKTSLETSREKIYLGLSKASTTEADLNVLDAALEKLIANGSIDKIFKRYGVINR